MQMSQIQGHVRYKLEQRSEDDFQENSLATRLLSFSRNVLSPVEEVVIQNKWKLCKYLIWDGLLN